MYCPSWFRPLFCCSLTLVIASTGCGLAADESPDTITDPARTGHDYRVQGEYSGQLKLTDKSQTWGGQVIALGNDQSELVLLAGGLPGDGWKRGDAMLKSSGKTADGRTTFAAEDWTASWSESGITLQSGDGESLGQLTKVVRRSPTLGMKPPANAVVLFDGSSAEQFERGQIVMEDLLAANCETLEKFGDHRLHIEFRTPFKPAGRGQGRGNSGVYVQNRYEVQVLDSFGLEGRNNECGGIYSIAEPLVNACLPPLTWQTYDIDFRAAHWDGDRKVSNARITVRHNGILIHNNLELPHGTPGKNPEGPGNDGLYLQGHGNPVVYRNIWVQPGTAADDDTGFVSIFDGKSLENWDGNPKFWSVRDDSITGQTTTENPTKGNTFIIWRGGEVGDFELKLQYRIVGGNSGIQYRSLEVENQPWVVGGYQGDFEAGKTFSGILYGERFRGILALRGQATEIQPNHKPRVLGVVGETNAIQAQIRDEDWNDYHITAKGFHFVHRINGTVTAECRDADEEMRRDSGILALQLHAGPPMTVQFRNIRLKRLEPLSSAGRNSPQPSVSARWAATQPSVPARTAALRRETGSDAKPRKVILIAGTPSHGYGAHEHKAGCMLLARALNESGLGIEAEVITNGWPKDDTLLDAADAIVVYADGGGRHPAMQHLERIEQLMQRGVGLTLIHYAVEIPKGDAGDAFIRWTGGYFETFWSVNPHWTADYAHLPEHPITRGVKPFVINDEWYYHMRFRDEMQGVTPILTAVPPASTLSRKDGAHSNNPHVRAKQGQPQHMAWATERTDGGRGFGFTGGHFHWNWGHPDFRKLVLNAIAWTAHVDIPTAGVPNPAVTLQDLEANQDYSPNDNYNPARIQKLLDEWTQTAAR